MNGPSASSANPIVMAIHPVDGRYRARHQANAMIASDTTLRAAVYSTKTDGCANEGSPKIQRMIGCCGCGVMKASRSTPGGLLRQKIVGLTKRPSINRLPRPYKTGDSGPTQASAATIRALTGIGPSDGL